MDVDSPIADAVNKEIKASRAYLADLNESILGLAEKFEDQEDHEYAEQCLLISELLYHIQADLNALTQRVDFWRRARARVKP